MMRRPKIRDLLKEAPDYDELIWLLSSASQPEQSDVVLSVVGASILERSLQHAISSKLPNINAKGTWESIFGDRGAISSFSAKIDVAHALNLVPTEYRNDLHCLRRIRNAFAHSVRTLSFDSPEIEAELRAITLWNTIHQTTDVERHGLSVARSTYTSAVFLNTFMLFVQTKVPSFDLSSRETAMGQLVEETRELMAKARNRGGLGGQPS